MKAKNDHRTKLSNLRKKPEKYQGFNGIRTRDLRDTGAMLDQLSWEATHWERDHLLSIQSLCVLYVDSARFLWELNMCARCKEF